jgi:hypothetical protein
VESISYAPRTALLIVGRETAWRAPEIVWRMGASRK